MTDQDHIGTQLRSVMATLEREVEPSSGFEARLVDLVGHAPEAARTLRRWLLPAAAAVTVALVAAAVALRPSLFAHSSAGHSSASNSAAHPPTRLTARQRTLALRTAHQEAEGANPNHPGPIVPVRGWPTYVDSVSATVMLHSRALRYLDNSTSNAADARVLVVQLRGRFGYFIDAPTPHGAYHKLRHATVITAVVTLTPGPHYGQTTDGGIGPRKPPLPSATILYRR